MFQETYKKRSETSFPLFQNHPGMSNGEKPWDSSLSKGGPLTLSDIINEQSRNLDEKIKKKTKIKTKKGKKEKKKKKKKKQKQQIQIQIQARGKGFQDFPFHLIDFIFCFISSSPPIFFRCCKLFYKVKECGKMYWNCVPQKGNVCFQGFRLLKLLYSNSDDSYVELLNDVPWEDCELLSNVLLKRSKVEVVLREQRQEMKERVEFPALIFKLSRSVLNVLYIFWERIVNAEKILFSLLRTVGFENTWEENEQQKEEQQIILRDLFELVKRERVELSSISVFLANEMPKRRYDYYSMGEPSGRSLIEAAMQNKVNLDEELYLEFFWWDFWFCLRGSNLSEFLGFCQKWKTLNESNLYLTPKIFTLFLQSVCLMKTTKQTARSAIYHLQLVHSQIGKQEPLFPTTACKFWKRGCKNHFPDCILGFGIWTGDINIDMKR